MSELGPLYHWSPRRRLSGIKRTGLEPGKKNLHNSEFIQPAISASLDAATAWNYSHGAWKSKGEFDLWQFWIAGSDDVRVNNLWGKRIIEVRIHNRIPKSR